MTQRVSVCLFVLVLPLLLAGSRLQSTWAEGDESAGEVELAQFLEGFAPLAKHGEWTRTSEREDFSGERPEGLQDGMHLQFTAPDKSKQMSFVAARFGTTAQAQAFLEVFHRGITKQLTQMRTSALASVWLDDVSKGAGKEGLLDGYAIDFAVDVAGPPFHAIFQYLHVERLFVVLAFAGCSHVSRETQDAFIAYALRRLTDPAAEPPPSPEMQVPAHEVTFQLRDPAGEPIAHAEATAHAASGGGAGTAVPVHDGGTMSLPEELVKVRVGHATGTDGRPLPLMAEEIVIRPKQSEVSVTLARGEPCSIHVVGADGSPVPGAEVRTVSRRFREEPWIVVQSAGEALPQKEELPPVGDGKGTTDAGGEILLPVDPKRGSRLAVDAGEDFFPEFDDVFPETGSKTIRLRPAWTLHLTVRDRDGTPVEDSVEVRIEGKTRWDKTDSAGRVEFGPLPREPAHVRGFLDDWSGENWTEVKPTRDPVVLTLTSRLLRLHVLDSAGAAVPRYWVDVRTDDPGMAYRAYGREGKGSASLLTPPGRCFVEVREAKDADERPLNLAAAGSSVSREARELTLRMLPGIQMTGTVRTADGKPVADAQILAERSYDVYARTKTDAEGRYELVGLDPHPISIVVRPPEGQAPPRPLDVHPSAGGSPVEIALPAAVPITVLDWRGRPVHGAWVRVRVTAGPDAGTWPVDDHTGEDGVAYLANLYPEQELEVMPQNSRGLASLRQRWDGSRTTLRLEQAHTVHVRVVDGAGPVTGAWVEVEGGEDHVSGTGPDGRTDAIVPSRPMRLRARRGESAPWSEWVEVAPHAHELEIRIPDAAR